MRRFCSTSSASTGWISLHATPARSSLPITSLPKSGIDIPASGNGSHRPWPPEPSCRRPSPAPKSCRCLDRWRRRAVSAPVSARQSPSPCIVGSSWRLMIDRNGCASAPAMLRSPTFCVAGHLGVGDRAPRRDVRSVSAASERRHGDPGEFVSSAGPQALFLRPCPARPRPDHRRFQRRHLVRHGRAARGQTTIRSSGSGSHLTPAHPPHLLDPSGGSWHRVRDSAAL